MRVSDRTISDPRQDETVGRIARGIGTEVGSFAKDHGSPNAATTGELIDADYEDRVGLWGGILGTATPWD